MAHTESIPSRKSENIAAVSAVIHGNQKVFDKFYQAHSPKFGGFPGIWTWCAGLGEAFTKVEAAAEKKGVEFEWIDAIDSFCSMAMTTLAGNDRAMAACAQKAINDNSF